MRIVQKCRHFTNDLKRGATSETQLQSLPI